MRDIDSELDQGLPSINPATGDIIGRVPSFSATQVEEAVERARQAQQAWARVPVKVRGERLLSFCEVVAEHAEELVDLLVMETSKARLEALINEVLVLVDLLTWHAEHAPEILKPRVEKLHLLKHRKGIVSYEPRGVVAVISPWNYPLMLPFSDIGMSSLAGNATVLKPSEHSPLVALRAKELWDRSQMPDELLQVVTGGPAVAEALIDAGVQKVAFTGGIASGRKVAERCGRNLVECVLELGGKAPMIVRADADLERTARAIAWGGFANMGQACVSVERVLAHDTIYEDLVNRSRERVLELRQGTPEEADIDVGAVMLASRLDYFDDLIRDATERGARLVCGGSRLERRGNFFAPTLLADCTPEMRVMQQEIFGPIVPMMRVRDDEHALEIANSLPFGLTSYVFGRDTAQAERVAARIEAGSVVINDVHSDIATPEVPFGGIKQSGYGRIHGREGLRSMCVVKHVSVNRTPLPARSPFWFPYRQSDFPLALRALRLMFTGKGPLGRIARWL